MEIQSDIVKSRIDHETKIKAQAVLSKVGLTMSDAMRLFLNQVIIQNGLPFNVSVPNSQTIKAIDASEKGELIESSLDDLRNIWHDAEKN
jgi:DNA-damage-inducible protein J